MNLQQARQPDAPPGSGSGAFGQSYQTPDGATIIPLSHPPGIFVVKDGKPIWTAASNDTRIALFGILVGLVAATLAGVTMVRRPPWPDLHGDVTKLL